MAPHLIAIYITTAVITSYRSVPAQTDNSPYYTAIGEHVNCHGVAVSQDLLRQNGGPLNYGDLIYIDGLGYKFVNDTMNKRFTKHLDNWVSTLEEEKAFHHKWKGRQVLIWKVIQHNETVAKNTRKAREAVR